MHPDVAKLVEAGKVKPEIGQALDSISPGSYRTHKSFGGGKVESWDLSSGKVTIDFEKGGKKELGLQLALNKTDALADDDVRAQKVSQLEELKELATENPTELVARVLRSRPGGRMTLDQLDAELAGSVVPEVGYKKWWERTKKILREDKLISVPTKRTDPIVLRDESASPGEALVEDFEQARSPRARVKGLEAISRETPLIKSVDGLLERVYSISGEAASKLLKLNAAQALEVLALRDEIAAETETEDQIPEGSPRIHEFLQVASATLPEDLNKVAAARLKRILEAFPTAFGDDWVAQILRVFDHISARGVSEIAKLLQEKEETKKLNAHLKKAISRHSLGADALAWICRERKKAAEKVFSGQVGSVVLTVLEQDAMDDGPRKAGRLATLVMDDKALIPDLLAKEEVNDVRNFARKLLSSPAFPDLDRKSLMARVIKAHPDTQDMVTGQTVSKREETLLVSHESLERRKKEYEDLVNNRIPANVKDISIARSYGDLRENFEYHAAKQMQNVLNTRKIELERDLERARPTTFENPDLSAVNIGTKFLLAFGDGDERQYTMLGAWDADPDKLILSYLSEMGQALLGKPEGESVEVTDPDTEKLVTVTIQAIEAA